MNIFERFFGKSAAPEEDKPRSTKVEREEKKDETELQKKAIKVFEKYTEEELAKMSPEEREKFFEGRKEVKRKNP